MITIFQFFIILLFRYYNTYARSFICLVEYFYSARMFLMNEEKINQIINLARSLIGTPYSYGADTGQKDRFDCSSFVQYVFEQAAEIKLPRSAILQAADEQGKELPLDNLDQFQVGDLIFMRSDRGHYNDELFSGRKIDIGHVAIISSPNTIIHAKSSLGGVVEQSLEELLSDPHYEIVFAKRFWQTNQELEINPLSQFLDVKQSEWQQRACGIISLKMCLDELELENKEVDELIQIGIDNGAYQSKTGWIHDGLVSLAKNFGASEAKNFDWSKESSQSAFAKLWPLIGQRPLIASIFYHFKPENQGGHLIVLAGLKDNKLVIYDPEEKEREKIRKEITIKDFSNGWKKRIILF